MIIKVDPKTFEEIMEELFIDQGDAPGEHYDDQ